MKRLISSTMILNRGIAVNDDIADYVQEIAIDGYIIYSIDTTWGADADGNRAVQRCIIEDIDDLMAYDQDGEEVLLTKVEENQAAEILTRKFLEN